MTESGLDLFGGSDSKAPAAEPPKGPGRRRAEKPPRKGRGGWVVLLVVMALLVGGSYWGWQKASSVLNGPEDYAGQGSGKVVVEIKPGQNGQQIARTLYKQGVVKSAEAFYQLSLNDERAQSLQPGFFKLRKKMSADWAMRELVDKGNRVEGRVTIPEGSRVGQIVKAIAAGSEISEDDVTAALDDPDSIGLPPEANGNPEGYLYPATYTVEPGTDATELLSQMVKKTLAVEKDLDIDTRAKALGLSKEEVLVVASILEYEANKDEDYPKVARVIYNRLDQDIALQMDSTVSYVSQREGDVWTTPEERANPSDYNTYQHQGLPPGPIGSPGEATIEAALNPADGPWLYFVPDYENDTTLFTDDYAEHVRNAEKLKDYCRTHEEC